MRRLLTLVLLLGTTALAACGDDGDAGATTAGADKGAFPVTVASRFGEATLDAEPKRIVTLDNQSTDDVLALGVTPVGIAKVTYVPGDMQPWTKKALGDAKPAMLDLDTSVPFERIAALRPDLIVGPHAFLVDKKTYERLSRIAPTIAPKEDGLKDDWRTTASRIGKAVGRSERAAKLIAQTEKGLADARERTPAFEGATINIFNADPSGLYTINDPQDYSLQLMAELGMKLSPTVARLKGESGRTQISKERYDLLEADLLLGTSVSMEHLGDLREDRLFKRLDAVKDGRLIALPMNRTTSVVFPSILSVQAATRDLVPLLARAASRAA